MSVGRPLGSAHIFGDHHGQDVTRVRSAATFGDEDRPVLVDQANFELARNIGGGEHRDDSRERPGASVVSILTTSARA